MPHRAFTATQAPRAGAMEQLLAQLLPGLMRWVRGRLPRSARRRMDSGDLVQEGLIGALVHLPDLHAQTPQSIRAYVQASIRNRIRDEIRRSVLGEVSTQVDERMPDSQPSPLDQAISGENERRYRAALVRLDPEDQALLVGRLDLKLSYGELAAALGRPSADAARVAIRRALLRLAREMAQQ